MLETSVFSKLGPRIRLPQPVCINSARVVAKTTVRPVITSDELNEELTGIIGTASEQFPFSTRIFEFDLKAGDHVIVRAAENGLPLVIRRDEEVIVNFDIQAMQAFRFLDSQRPIYTYIPGFNIQTVPEGFRRSLSNVVHSLYAPRNKDIVASYRRLPLTSFEFVILLLDRILAKGPGFEIQAFQWPSGKRAVFVPLHDVDTPGFLRRRERDPLFRLEEKHQIKATWFVPSDFLKGDKGAIDFLLQSGNEVGWHGDKHDHKLPFKPFAERQVQSLKNCFDGEPERFPAGMRAPKLLKSNSLFELLERSCPALCYDTSFLQGIVPYYLWLNGRQSRILEIPTTVPTDIRVYNELHGIPRSRRPEYILEAQIARTKKLMEVGGIISIVTHPEKHLTERPDFLDVYDQYLSYIKSCPDIWFATARELFTHWSGNDSYRVQ